MANNVTVGDKVFVPVTRLGNLGDYPFAIKECEVAQVENRSIRVTLTGGNSSDLIGLSVVHSNVGILVLNIGDLSTETTLLDPLAKSILQYCRMLVPDDQLKGYKVRSQVELGAVWEKEQAGYSHVILCGHGKPNSMIFGVENEVAIGELLETFRIHGASPKNFENLCQVFHFTI